jgi:transforming growth factor-beta-induced protein
MKFKPYLLASLVVVLLVSACATTAVEVTEEPKPTATPVPEPTAEPMEEPMALDIVDTAVADGRFTTLVAAVEAAGLVDALKADGPLTVFAPTDDAFAALPEGTVEALLGDIPALTDILLYHVVEGKVMAADVVALSSAPTLLGQDLSISVMDGNVKVNESQVIITDIETSNGVIHVIDAVLLPQ